MATEQGTQARAEALARTLGEQRVGIRRVDWTPYTTEGVLVKITLRRFRGEQKATLADLGIQTETKEQRDAIERILELPRRYLLPAEILKGGDTLEAKIRYNLTTHAFKTAWGFFVHVSRYAQWRESHLKLAEEYAAYGQMIASRYDELRERTVQDYRVLAMRLYTQMSQRQTPLLDQILTTGIDAWCTQFAEAAISALPDAAAIARSYQCSYGVAMLPNMTAVAADRAEAERIALEAQERARLSAEDAMARDLRRTMLEEASRGIEQFVADVKQQVHAEVYNCCLRALDVVQKSRYGRVDRNSSVWLRNVIAMTREMVFWDEPELDRRIAEVERLLTLPSAGRSEREMQRALRSLGAVSRLALMEIGRPPERSGQTLGIPDAPDLLTRMAGQEIGSAVVRAGEDARPPAGPLPLFAAPPRAANRLLLEV